MAVVALSSLSLFRLASSRFRKPFYHLFSFSFSTTTSQPPPIRVGLTDSVGRAVFATRPIPAGDVIHPAKPAVCHPSPSADHSVCYCCLARLRNLSTSQPHRPSFCSELCHQHSKEYYDVEMKANWKAFDDHCRKLGMKLPVLVKRLACMVISGVARSDSLDILQPANLTPEMISLLEEGFVLLRNAFTEALIADEHIACILRDIEEGEELRICYLGSLDRDARRELLFRGFGFQCNCNRCLHGD